MKVVLCSQSPRRRELLQRFLPRFEQRSADVEEWLFSADEREEARQLQEGASLALYQEKMQALALRKAEAVWTQTAAEERKNRLFLAADTLLYFEGKSLGKPADEKEAFQMLTRLAGRRHQVLTAVACLGEDKRSCFSFVHTSDIEFYPLSKEEIWQYIQSEEVLDKAGSYGIQEGAALFVKEIRGDFYSIMGLPLAALWQEWKARGLLPDLLKGEAE